MRPIYAHFALWSLPFAASACAGKSEGKTAP